MSPGISEESPQMLISIGLVVGILISLVDNFAFGGEVGPIVIVLLLLVATIASGTFWGVRGWLATIATWACLPLAHLLKHLLGLPDTLQPNTYASILKLAIFTLIVTAVGTGIGILMRRFRKVNTKADVHV